MKNYTSLEKMKASEVCASYTEEKVTAESFKEEVKKGTLYKGFEPPKNATMLKFRYYSPDGTLIEQNNVPVVYDGTGIESVKTYYLLTDVSAGITVEKDKNGRIKTGSSPDEWSEAVKTVTKTSRFLWTCTETLYTNKAVEYTEPCISAVYGEQGERGAMYLGHYKDNQAAYEANKPAVFNGDYYLNTTDSYIYVYSSNGSTWTKIDKFDDWRYNQSINDIFAAIEDSEDAEKFIRAKKIWVQHIAAAVARVETLYSNIIKLTQGKDLDGNTKGGLIQSANYDGTIQNGAITKAGTKGWAVDYAGKAEFNDVTVRGTVDGSTIKGSTISGTTITGGTVNGTEIKGGSININDNFTVNADGSTEIKQNCSVGGFLNQGVGSVNLGLFGISYYNSSMSIRGLSLSTDYWEAERLAKGRYRLYFHENWIYSPESPLKYMFENYPPEAYQQGIDFNTYYKYLIQAVPVFASDTYYSGRSETKNNITYQFNGISMRNPIFTQAIRAKYINEPAIGIIDGSSFSENFGFIWGTSPKGIDSLSIDIVFTDNQNDSLIDPGYAIFDLNVYYRPYTRSYNTAVLPFGVWSAKSFETQTKELIEKNGNSYRQTALSFPIRIAGGSYITVPKGTVIYYLKKTIGSDTYNIFGFGVSLWNFSDEIITSSISDDKKLTQYKILITSKNGTFLNNSIQLKNSLCFQ